MRMLTALAVLVLAVGCQTPPPEMTRAEKDAIAEEVLQAAHALFAAGAVNDFEAMNASWITDPTAYFVGEPAMYLNRLVLLADVDAIRAYWEPAQETRSGTNLIPSQEHVAVLSRDAAVHVYKGDWNVMDLEGNVSAQGPITATTVFVREDGEWKQLHYHQSWETVEAADSSGG